jgi:hypothetical protein
MSDVSPGPDWWQASDGKWYPPHLHPDVLNATQMPAESVERSASTATMTRDQTEMSPAVEPAGPVAESVYELDAQPVASTEATAPSSPPWAGLPPYTPPDAPAREPIDWDRVSAERSARRQAEQSRRRRNLVGAGLVALGTLALLVGIATNRAGDGDDGDDDNANDSSTTSTTVASSSTDLTTTTVATTTTGAGGVTPVSVFELQPGMCVNNPELSSGLVTDLSAVACELPHTHEVYFKVTYNPPDGAFDAQRVASFADEQCAQAFTTYVGVPYDRSKYYFLHLAPSAESWKEQGDRDVVCLLFQQGATLTGSAKGSAQ